MAKKNRARRPATSSGTRTRSRKVTYSLPDALARELDRRHSESGTSRSRMVAEALAFYFAEEDKAALAAIYREAARDPLFQEDNAAILEDFELLDGDPEPTRP